MIQLKICHLFGTMLTKTCPMVQSAGKMEMDLIPPVSLFYPRTYFPPISQPHFLSTTHPPTPIHPSIHPLIFACPSSIHPLFQICLLKVNCEASSHFSLRIQFNSLEKFRTTSKWMTESPGFHLSHVGSLH